MNPTLRNILAVIAGILVGSAINMAIVKMSASIIAPPQGTDLTTEEGLKKAMHLFEPKHFLMPFLAHALGTFFGALLTAFIAVSHQVKLSLGIAVIFLLGGIYMVIMMPSPLWYTLVDLLGAYLPMGYIAAMLVVKKESSKN